MEKFERFPHDFGDVVDHPELGEGKGSRGDRAKFPRRWGKFPRRVKAISRGSWGRVVSGSSSLYIRQSRRARLGRITICHLLWMIHSS